ncbi:MAG TPA: OsmC family protein [Burkholderiales bacterium]|nr:OsmC family protein [Burkholderiales bacterium]
MQGELVITKCSVAGAAEDPNYRQAVRCGRHEMIVDERPARGGADAGPMPFEYLLASLGACTSITLRMYAERKGWDIGAVGVSLSLRQDKEGTRTIERRVTLSGTLTAQQLEKLADICEKTPVTLAVKSGLSVRTTLEGSAPATPR